MHFLVHLSILLDNALNSMLLHNYKIKHYTVKISEKIQLITVNNNYFVYFKRNLGHN